MSWVGIPLLHCSGLDASRVSPGLDPYAPGQVLRAQVQALPLTLLPPPRILGVAPILA